jgi:signal transduction histidine kinase
MDLTTGALLVAGAFNLLLSAVILFQAPRTRASLAYAALVGTLLLWTAAILALLLARSPRAEFLALATSYLAGTAIAIAFWYFVTFFAVRRIRLLQHALLLGGGLLVTLLAFGSPHFIRGIERLPSGNLRLDIGSAHWVFIGFFSAVMTAAFLRLAERYRTASPSELAPLGWVFLGTFLTALIGSTFNIALVALGNASLIGWGPVATIIMVTCLAVAIMRHHLMSIRLVGTEVFTLALVILLVVDLVFVPGGLARLLNGLTLFFAAGFGVLLIRSALREAESRERLSAANEELRRLDAAKSEFISLAGHELRTPLTLITQQTSALLEGSYGEVPGPGREPLGRILGAAKRLVGLVGELLDLSRIEAGRIRYEFRQLRLEGIIHEVLAQLQQKAAERRVVLRFRSENDGGLYATADPDKIREVVLNLVDNAIAYSPAGGTVDLRLRAMSYDGRRSLVLSVTDHGIGITPEDLPRLFGKFARSEEARRMRPDGMGLGLYLVKRLVEDHHGRVWAESPGPGRGSTFFVELPVSGGQRPSREQRAVPAARRGA